MGKVLRLASTAATIPRVPGLPLLGNALQLARDPYGFLRDCYHEHGSLFRLDLMGQRPVVFAGPEANVLLKEKERTHFAAAPAFEPLSRALGTKRFLMTLDGDVHKQLRNAMGPAVSHKQMAGYVPKLEAIAKSHLQRLTVEHLEAVVVDQDPHGLTLEPGGHGVGVALDADGAARGAAGPRQLADDGALHPGPRGPHRAHAFAVRPAVAAVAARSSPASGRVGSEGRRSSRRSGVTQTAFGSSMSVIRSAPASSTACWRAAPVRSADTCWCATTVGFDSPTTSRVTIGIARNAVAPRPPSGSTPAPRGCWTCRTSRWCSPCPTSCGRWPTETPPSSTPSWLALAQASSPIWLG